MKSIQLISACVEKMKQLNIPATIEIGTFKLSSSGHLVNCAGSQGQYDNSLVSFEITFRSDHIQTLIDCGVKFDFNTVVMADLSEKALRFKSGREAINQGRYAPYYYRGNPENRQTGVIENWLNAKATCNVSTLEYIDKYCRDNHRNKVSIDNDHNLVAAGWRKKEKYTKGIFLMSKSTAKKIRKNVADKKKKIDNLLTIEKRAIEQKKYE